MPPPDMPPMPPPGAGPGGPPMLPPGRKHGGAVGRFAVGGRIANLGKFAHPAKAEQNFTTPKASTQSNTSKLIGKASTGKKGRA